MSPQKNRFFLVFRDESGLVHEEELDFNALIHDVAFSAVCQGRLANDGRWDPVELEPELADGKVVGVTVQVAGLCRTYGRTIFNDRATEVRRTSLLELSGTGERPTVSWEVQVRGAPETQPDRKRVSVRVRLQAYPFVRRDLIELGPQHQEAAADTVSVCVSAVLLEELRRESASSLDRERADFLVGHLVLKQDGNVVVMLVDRIPADTETEASLVHFSFSPRTFQAAQRELEQRGTDHVILGHHHNHPPHCGSECLMTVPACSTDNVFFSVDDRIVHRSAFGKPYMVALVSGKGAQRRADNPVMKAYGWRRGLICEREYSIF
jgi:hypothetical protein